MSGRAPLGPPVWAGQRGRLEVWYATFTDQASGLGGWVHLETVAPTGDAEAYAHGWAAVFPADGAPVLERFGPAPIASASAASPGDDVPWCRVGSIDDSGTGWATVGRAEGAAEQRSIDGPARLRGAAGSLAWDLLVTDSSPPLHTFPRAVWDRRLLPAAQVVPLPAGVVTGSLTIAGKPSAVHGPGALARIYGHGSAQRWGWLHADLGDGAVLEIVSATARRAVLRRVPPLALVQLRLPGEQDWPANPLLAAVRFRTELRADGFTVVGATGGRRLSVDVDLPVASRVALGYTDPDGGTATCTNSERAVARVELTGRRGEQRWTLDGTAHAEVGTRP